MYELFLQNTNVKHVILQMIKINKLGGLRFIVLGIGLLGCLVLSTWSMAATKTFVGADLGNWNTATNWSPSGVPAAGDSVVIPSLKTVTINTSLTIVAGTTLKINGNIKFAASTTLTVSGRLVVNGDVDFSANSVNLTVTATGEYIVIGSYTEGGNSSQKPEIDGKLIILNFGGGTFHIKNSSGDIYSLDGSLEVTGDTGPADLKDFDDFLDDFPEPNFIRDIVLNQMYTIGVSGMPGSANLCGSTNVALELLNPRANCTYKWHKSTSTTTPADVNEAVVLGTSSSYTVTATGTYQLYVYENGSTTPVKSNQVVVENTGVPLNVSITPANPAICNGSSVTLTSSLSGVDYSYKWINASTLAQVSTASTATITAGGDYQLTVKQASTQCVGTATKNIAETTVAKPSITGTLSFCEGSSTTLSVASPVGGINYSWNPSGTGSSLEVFTPGSYSVTALSGSCSATSNSVSVTQKAKPLVSISGSNPACNATSASYTVSSSNKTLASYAWSAQGGSYFTTTFNPFSVSWDRTLTPTKVLVTVTDTEGCNNTGELAVTIIPLPNDPTGFDVFTPAACPGSSVPYTVTAVAGVSAYKWQINGIVNGQNTASASFIFPVGEQSTVRINTLNSCGESSPESLSATVDTHLTPGWYTW